MGCCGGGNMNGHHNRSMSKTVTKDSKHQQHSERKFNFIPVLSIGAIGLIIYYLFEYIV